MKKKLSFVNIIFFVVFGVLTGVLWAYLCPIPLIPGAVHFRTFAFIIVVIGYLFGPVTGFFSGYIGTIVWALLSGNFIPLHSPLADGITVGLSAALPALVHMRGKKDLLALIDEGKGKFIGLSLFWSLLFGVLMILTTSLSLSYFAGLEYSYCVIWIGIADVVPIALTPFVVLLLAKRMKNIRNIVPYI
ncbi:MAG TPA: aminotriazole resistance protein [Candidatus Eisenbergiella merdavium]|uniref:Aminotriazole resistance protein n=1 Tax=Candidatus Eisenbergiella merdavium TaxID=2838551 RepID=A0A9D2NBX0_9FIRM|nr:aminotriazole resistance protein [Candidatus Eisenbergiella merdavium]